MTNKSGPAPKGWDPKNPTKGLIDHDHEIPTFHEIPDRLISDVIKELQAFRREQLLPIIKRRKRFHKLGVFEDFKHFKRKRRHLKIMTAEYSKTNQMLKAAIDRLKKV